MLGIVQTIGKLIAVLVDTGVIKREKAVRILEPLKVRDKVESGEE